MDSYREGKSLREREKKMGTPIKKRNYITESKATASPQTKTSYAMLPPTPPSNKQKPSLTHSNQFQLLDEESISSPPPQNYQQALASTIPPVAKYPYQPSTSQLPAINQPPQYFEKESTLSVCIIEPENWKASFQETISTIFPKDFLFVPDEIFKTRKFYEFILVDSDSAEITHNLDKNDPSRIAFSKCKIKKIFRPQDWPVNIYNKRRFTQPFVPQEYSYIDYQKAWFNTFFLANKTHSWFFIFCKECPKQFPKWFQQWFNYFGLNESIFPPDALEGFQEFSNNFNNNEEPLLAFSSHFLVAWIMSWEFFITTPPPPKFRELRRKFFIKWWSNFSTDNVKKSAIHQWLTAHPQYCNFPQQQSQQQSSFLTHKAKILAELAKCQSLLEMDKIIGTSSSQKSNSDTEAPDEFNEDDYYLARFMHHNQN